MENTNRIKKYEYLISNGHHLVKIDNKVFVVDTGSPISFSIAEDFKFVVINDNTYEMKNNIVRINKNELNEFTGFNIDGFIGSDILSKIGGIGFNKIEKSIIFASGIDFHNGVRVPIKLFGALGMNYIDIKLIAGGNNISALLDTGACMSYIDPEIAEFGKPDGNAEDYSPTFGGWIKTTKVKLPVIIGSQTQDISMAIMTRTIQTQLSMFGYKAVLGVNEIHWEKLSIDLRNNELVYE